jgi:fructose-1-phosphate kinase PfkB-like protein
MGADGLVYSDGATVVHVAPPLLTVRTAVGAGDALLGGLVWALTQGLPAVDVACWGVATGAVYVQDDALPADAQSAVRQMIRCLQVTMLKP